MYAGEIGDYLSRKVTRRRETCIVCVSKCSTFIIDFKSIQYSPFHLVAYVHYILLLYEQTQNHRIS